jgi:hypothetical protein
VSFIVLGHISERFLNSTLTAVGQQARGFVADGVGTEQRLPPVWCPRHMG